MIKNDTNMTCQHQNFEIENRLLNFCVDKSVGGKSPEVSRHVLKGSPKDNEHFQAYDMGAELCRDMRTTKKPTKSRKLWGLELRWFK